MELDGDNAPVRKYTWGLDLAGQMGGAGILPANLQAAGGIGGLLATYDANGTPMYMTDDLNYVYLYDANGNVGQVIDPNAASATASIKAHYEYDPYGSRINTPAPGEYDQPWRFSTKQLDAETGLGYWGYRYYDRGRWISRDPIGEAGGANIYSYVRNRTVDRLDPWGLWTTPIPPLPEWPGGGAGPAGTDHSGEDGRWPEYHPNPCRKGWKLILDDRPTLTHYTRTTSRFGGWLGATVRTVVVVSVPRYQFLGSVTIGHGLGATYNPEFWRSFREPLFSDFYLASPTQIEWTWLGQKTPRRLLAKFQYGAFRNTQACGSVEVNVYQRVYDVTASMEGSVPAPGDWRGQRTVPGVFVSTAMWYSEDLYTVWCAECPH